MIKNFRSIDGFFNKQIEYQEYTGNILKSKKYSILGSGNSISNLPYNEKSILLKNKSKQKIILNKKNLEITASGDMEVYKIHNFLIKNSLYIASFPSFPTVTLAACVANCVHGLQPKKGCIDKYIKNIKIYNPNFGFKVLNRKKNSDLFYLTIGGMGLTGIIHEVTLKAVTLKSTFIKRKTFKVDSLLEGYFFLKRSKSFYNQNNFFIMHSQKKFSEGIISTGNFYKRSKILKEVKKKKISQLRFGLFDFEILRIIINKLMIYFFKILYYKNIIHINEALFPSNQRLLYFNLLKNKFIEHQVIIPDKYVQEYLKRFETIVRKIKPSISLCHLKIFSGNGKNLQFIQSGLGIAMHIMVNKNFKIFYTKLKKLDFIYKCKVNLYKNSMADLKLIKKNYPKNYEIFKSKIKKINKTIYFTNKIFNEKFYND